VRTRLHRRPVLLAVLLLLSGLLSCASGEEDQKKKVTLQADCNDTNASPPAASVAVQCADVTTTRVTVDVVVTDSPPAEAIVSAVLDMSFSSQIASFESCAAGDALGAPADVEVICNASGGELLVAVTRQGLGPGVQVSGTRTLVRLTFKIRSLGPGSLDFLAVNQEDGSALLRRNPFDFKDLQVIPGILFLGATISGT
jgi:hypothetical protein